MQDPTEWRPSRRQLLGVLAAGTLAGCLGDGAATDEPVPTAAPGAEPPLPTDDGTGAGDTSLAGSCAAAFGDTDQQYEHGSSAWVVDFAYPMAGEVFDAGTDGEEWQATIGYDRGPDDGYAHELSVVQSGPVEQDTSGGTLADGAEWERDGTVTYDSRERTVVTRSNSDSFNWGFGFEGSDGNYFVEVVLAAGTADPCPDVYETIARRVLDSVAPRAQ